MKKIMTILLCFMFTTVLCACTGTTQKNERMVTSTPTKAIRTETPSNNPQSHSQTTMSVTGTESYNVDAILNDMITLTANDDFEEISVDEPTQDTMLEKGVQDILSDLEKDYDMPIN